MKAMDKPAEPGWSDTHCRAVRESRATFPCIPPRYGRLVAPCADCKPIPCAIRAMTIICIRLTPGRHADVVEQASIQSAR